MEILLVCYGALWGYSALCFSRFCWWSAGRTALQQNLDSVVCRSELRSPFFGRIYLEMLEKVWLDQGVTVHCDLRWAKARCRPQRHSQPSNCGDVASMAPVHAFIKTSITTFDLKMLWSYRIDAGTWSLGSVLTWFADKDVVGAEQDKFYRDQKKMIPTARTRITISACTYMYVYMHYM